MQIRKTTANDIDAIMDIFASAKCYMKANGNASQWDDNYPGRDTLDNDIANGNSYVFIDNGEVVGTFAFICGEDETYRVIKTVHGARTPPTAPSTASLPTEACAGFPKSALTSAPQKSLTCAPTHMRTTARCKRCLKPMAFKSAARSTPLTALRSSHTTTSCAVDRLWRIGSAAWQQYCRSARLPFSKRALFWCSFRSQGRCSNDSRHRR